MRLADFILANVEPILERWDAFAREIWPDQANIDPAELRDHAEAILRAVVQDMTSDQTVGARDKKSRGRGEVSDYSEKLDTASDLHGAGRVGSGFRLLEVLAEYRALRASVFRLWRESNPNPHGTDLDDLTRFHESIDQSLARAVNSFTDRIDQSRRLFLAVLGHDLRNPLNAIMMSAQLHERELGQSEAPEHATEATDQIIASARAMQRMISDLLDFTAAGLGGGMPVSRAPADLHRICQEILSEMRAAHPDCDIKCDAKGDLTGHWDAVRLRQVVSNLVGNAIQHGDRPCDIALRLRGEDQHVEVEVHNHGSSIPASSIPVLFDPLRRLSVGTPHPPHRQAGSIGLGLFISHQIVTSHGGTIRVESSDPDGTTFTVHLPRGTASGPSASR